MLLEILGNGDLDDSTVESAEKYICTVYNVTDAEGCNEARKTRFSRCQSSEALPPTSYAARLHIRRAHFQRMIWKQVSLPLPDTIGWTKLNSKLVPTLMSLAPVPESCDGIVNYGCKSGCQSKKYSCWNVGLPCQGACKRTRTGNSHCTNNVNWDIENLGQWMVRATSFSTFFGIGRFKQLIKYLVSASVGKGQLSQIPGMAFCYRTVFL